MKKEKSVLFPFYDGNGYVRVGDKVYVEGQNRDSGIKEYIVSKVGIKYITIKPSLESYNESQYLIENGRIVSEYRQNMLWSSPEAFTKQSQGKAFRLALKESLYELDHISPKAILEAVESLGLQDIFLKKLYTTDDNKNTAKKYFERVIL